MRHLVRLAPVLALLALDACGDAGGGAPPAPAAKAGAAAPAPAKPAAPATPAAPGVPAAPGAAAAAGAAPTPAAIAEAEQIFTQRCVACHGADGKGTGVAAAALNPKPRDYSDKAWQAATPDALIEKAIVEGGMAVGKSPLMPPNPDLAARPDVIAGLREKVRSFGK